MIQIQIDLFIVISIHCYNISAAAVQLDLTVCSCLIQYKSLAKTMQLAWNYLATLGFSAKTASQTPTTVTLDAINEQTRVLANEFVYYFAKNAEPQSHIGVRMRKCVDSLSKEYGVQFDNMISLIDFRKENAVDALLSIARSLFEKDGNCNWGRVTTMLTFAGFVARKLTLEGDENFLDMFATAFGDYLVKTISEWIFKEGGWVRIVLLPHLYYNLHTNTHRPTHTLTPTHTQSLTHSLRHRYVCTYKSNKKLSIQTFKALTRS